MRDGNSQAFLSLESSHSIQGLEGSYEGWKPPDLNEEKLL